MQPNYIEIAKLFSNDERFTVPLFQRPYVWTRDDQWQPLWEDVAGVLRRLEARKGDEAVASHFLGTIVLEQKPTATGSLTRREVIDGQQRLTTLQILLKAAEHAIQLILPSPEDAFSEVWTMERDKVARLTKNLSSGEEQYKVWPTNEDRAPFQRVLNAKPHDGLKADTSRMAEAYRFFHAAVGDYLKSGDALAGTQRLVTGLRDYLKLIVLDLDKGDEPQAIFETLNAHGTPLLPADLMKNWLLWDAAKHKQDIEKLYEDFWRPFDRDHDYWRHTVGKGHAARARVDTFLQNWLTKETLEPVSAKHIYDRFLRFGEAQAKAQADGIGVAERLMKAIRTDATRFERIDKPTGNSRFDLFLDRLKSLDMIVFHPVLFELLDSLSADAEALNRSAAYLESYLVRRMICGMQTRGYGTLSIKLLRALRENKGGDLAETIRSQLLSLDGSDEWPSDEAFQREWSRRQFYGYFRRERVLMILRAIEHHYQTKSDKTEPLMTFDWSQVQIEHIMPQSWQQHWSLPDGITTEYRKASVQGIGNLTLVSKLLNPSLSNSAWAGTDQKPGKREALNKHAIMHMNRQLLDQFRESWSEDTIAARAATLFEDAKLIWQR
ncbi:MAG: DUF262 domain-containing HNH endonuclease family protein [Pseudomonadota bacterium]